MRSKSPGGLVPNVAMWGKALRVIPKISKEEWGDLDVVSRWLIATRFTVIVMTIIASVIGGLLAFRESRFRWRRVRRDHLGLGVRPRHEQPHQRSHRPRQRGWIQGNYFRTQYGPQPLEHGLLTVPQMLRYTAVTGGIALLAGGFLVFTRGQATLTLFAAGIFFVLFYTWPLKYFGMGEPAVLVVWGPLMVGGTYYVVTGRFDWNVALASLPFSLGATAVLFGKHIDKLDADQGQEDPHLASAARRLSQPLRDHKYARGPVPPRAAAICTGLLFRVDTRRFRCHSHLSACDQSVSSAAAQSGRPRSFRREFGLSGSWRLRSCTCAVFGALYVAGILLDVIAQRAGLQLTL